MFLGMNMVCDTLSVQKMELKQTMQHICSVCRFPIPSSPTEENRRMLRAFNDAPGAKYNICPCCHNGVTNPTNKAYAERARRWTQRHINIAA